jgi:phage baseplate assembly protein W
MNANTGRVLAGREHLSQSIGKILTTPLGACIQRRTFGSELVDLIDAPVNGATPIRLYAAIATALMRWEPRLTITRVQLIADTDDVMTGQQYVEIEGWTDEADEPASFRAPIPTGA